MANGGRGKCSVCADSRRVAIDAELVAETPHRQLAKRYGISRSSLQRHQQAHLGREIVALKREPREKPEGALARIENLYDGLQVLWDTAREDKAVGQMLAVARELRAAIELLAKLSGELNDRPQLTVNLLASDEFVQAIEVIFETLTPYPEAKHALVGRLRLLNGKLAG